MEDVKRCCSCKETKGLEQFHKNNAEKDGLNRACKTCMLLRYSKYRKERKAAGVCHCGRSTPKGKLTCNTCRRRTKVWRINNPEKATAMRRKQNRMQREICFRMYGDVCVCCGEDHQEFLQIDHINGGGNKHRKEIKRGGHTFYLWLAQHGFPNEYQLLCANCNSAKHYFGQCPHQYERTAILPNVSIEDFAAHTPELTTVK
jgi:hypothetical protein